MEFLIIGIVSALNLIIIKMKFERNRYQDGLFDLTLMALLAFLFSGSYGGMVVAMVGSLAISFYLLVSPPKFTSNAFDSIKKEIETIKEINR